MACVKARRKQKQKSLRQDDDDTNEVGTNIKDASMSAKLSTSTIRKRASMNALMSEIDDEEEEEEEEWYIEDSTGTGTGAVADISPSSCELFRCNNNSETTQDSEDSNDDGETRSSTQCNNTFPVCG